MIDSPDDKIIYKAPFCKEVTLTLAQALEPSSPDSFDTIERLEREVELLKETIGRMLAAMVSRHKIDLEDCKLILNEEFQITELEDFDNE